MPYSLEDRAAKRKRVYARMRPEAPVFEGQQQRKVGFAYLIGLRIQAPASVRCREGPQEMTVAVENKAR